jgi:hypothetical protein
VKEKPREPVDKSLKLRKWLVENPNQELLDEDGDKWRWSTEACRFEIKIKSRSQWVQASGPVDWRYS